MRGQETGRTEGLVFSSKTRWIGFAYILAPSRMHSEAGVGVLQDKGSEFSVSMARLRGEARQVSDSEVISTKVTHGIIMITPLAVHCGPPTRRISA
jgi:hypothetical protein